MAHIASVTENETGSPGEQTVTGTVTTDGDYYDSRLGTIDHVIISNRTNVGVTKVAVSGQRITITCTSGDVVDMIIRGKE